jgi:hypothetical protein
MILQAMARFFSQNDRLNKYSIIIHLVPPMFWRYAEDMERQR